MTIIEARQRPLLGGAIPICDGVAREFRAAASLAGRLPNRGRWADEMRLAGTQERPVPDIAPESANNFRPTPARAGLVAVMMNPKARAKIFLGEGYRIGGGERMNAGKKLVHG